MSKGTYRSQPLYTAKPRRKPKTVNPFVVLINHNKVEWFRLSGYIYPRTWLWTGPDGPPIPIVEQETSVQ